MKMEFDVTKMVEEIVMQAKENQEEFIIETIRPYCENILQIKINKEELKQILLNGMQKQQPCDDCISLNKLDDIITKAIDDSENQTECQTLRWVLDVMSELPSVTPQPRWIPVSERLPNNHEYIKNNGWFNVSDGNRSYFGRFDIYNMKKFVKPTIAGFCADNAIIAWMPLPQPYKAESEEEE